MTYENTEQLRRWLNKDGRTGLATLDKFEYIDDDEFATHLRDIKRSKRPESEHVDAAVFRCLTIHKDDEPATIQVSLQEPAMTNNKDIVDAMAKIQTMIENGFRHILYFLIVVSIMLLLASTLHAQNVNGAITVDSCGTPPANFPATGQRAYLTIEQTTGKLCVVTGGGGGGGTSETDNATFTGGSTSITPMGAIYDNTPPTVTDGHVGAPRMDVDRQLLVNCAAGCAAAGNTTGTLVALDTLDETAQVTLAGENGANVHLAAGTLAGTIVAEVSYDNGTNWGSAVFINPVTSAVTTSTVFTNPNAATDLLIGWVGAVTHARVRLSAVTGGASNVTLRSVVSSPHFVMFGSDGTNIKPIKTDSGGAVQVDVESGTITAVTAITNALPAGTNVIGHVIADTGSTMAVTGNVTAVQGTGTNLHTVVDSGTITVTDGAGALNVIVDSSALPSGAATVAKQPALGTAGTASTDVITIQGIAAMTKLLVTPDSVALPANQSVNVAQLAGTTTDTNSGNKSAGTLRVVLATDQPALTNKLLVTPDSVALPANQSVNINQINGVTPLMGTGNTGTGSPRVTISTDQVALAGLGIGATGAAPPANANYLGGLGSGATGGFTQPVTSCDSQAFLDMTTATTTELVALTASRKVYVCYWLMIANGTTVATFKRGTGSNCGTGTTTISNAWDLTAQVGFSGGAGLGAIFDNQNAGDALCVTNSAAVNLHIFVRYAKY